MISWKKVFTTLNNFKNAQGLHMKRYRLALFITIIFLLIVGILNISHLFNYLYQTAPVKIRYLINMVSIATNIRKFNGSELKKLEQKIDKQVEKAAIYNNNEAYIISLLPPSDALKHHQFICGQKIEVLIKKYNIPSGDGTTSAGMEDFSKPINFIIGSKQDSIFLQQLSFLLPVLSPNQNYFAGFMKVSDKSTMSHNNKLQYIFKNQQVTLFNITVKTPAVPVNFSIEGILIETDDRDEIYQTNSSIVKVGCGNTVEIKYILFERNQKGKQLGGRKKIREGNISGKIGLGDIPLPIEKFLMNLPIGSNIKVITRKGNLLAVNHNGDIISISNFDNTKEFTKVMELIQDKNDEEMVELWLTIVSIS